MTDRADREADFELLFDRHYEPVVRYMLRRLPVEDVNDAVAEVFVAAWRNFARIPTGMELPWLYGTARNVVHNSRRSRRRRAHLAEAMARQPADEGLDPVVVVIRDEESAAVLQALDRLKAADQEVLRLRAWEQQPSRAIAATLGISVHAAEMRLSRATKRLATALASTERVARPEPTPRPTVKEDLP